MTPAELLVDGFTRIQEGVHSAVEGLTPDQLAHQPGEGANSIGWLVWHLTRVQDDHVADAAGLDRSAARSSRADAVIAHRPRGRARPTGYAAGSGQGSSPRT